MKIHHAKFIQSASQPSGFVDDEGGEIAFAGRSNAGKSTAINAVCGQKSLARTSKTPGRTQLINFFSIGENLRLVDLPGYGFAKSAHSQRRKWGQLIEQYYRQRTSLLGTMLMMDVRHPLKDADIQMIEWCSHCQSPVHILLTKADKLSKNQAKNQLFEVTRNCSGFYQVSVQLFSGTHGTGLEEALKKIEYWAQKTNPGVV